MSWFKLVLIGLAGFVGAACSGKPAVADRAGASTILNEAVFNYCLPVLEGVVPKPALTEADGWAAMPPQDGSTDPRQGHTTGVEVELSTWTGPSCMVRGQMRAEDGVASRLRARLTAAGWEEFNRQSFFNAVSTFHRVRKGDPERFFAVMITEKLSPNAGYTVVSVRETGPEGLRVKVRP